MDIMSWVEWLTEAGFPTRRLQGTPWVGSWREADRRSLILTTRVVCILGAVLLIFHHMFIDGPLGLEPRGRWVVYRFGLAAMCLALVLSTFTSWAKTTRFYRLPLATTGFVVSYLQAWAMIWFDGVPYEYAIVFPAAAGLLLRCSALKSGIYLMMVYGAQWGLLRQSSVQPSYLLSGIAVASSLVIMFRSRMPLEISGFIAQKELLKAQENLLEVEVELNREISAFLPREIHDRIIKRWSAGPKNIRATTEDVLRPQLKTLACLFSDIRGFTGRSRDLLGYVHRGALPNIRICAEIVEAYRGVPRLIGDAMFAYFDEGTPELLLSKALACAFALVDQNQKWNGSVPTEIRIRRFVIISFGEAIVGNIGGRNSAREITALGPPVNILPRIDAVTKDAKIDAGFDPGRVLLTQLAGEAVRFCFPDLEMVEVDLARLEVQIRDFPEEKRLWLVPVTGLNRKVIGLRSGRLST